MDEKIRQPADELIGDYEAHTELETPCLGTAFRGLLGDEPCPGCAELGSLRLKAGTLKPRANALEGILEPLRKIEAPQLRRIVAALMARPGEYMACALALQRAIDLAHPEKPKAPPGRKLTIDEAYSSTTVPLGASGEDGL